MVRGLRLAPDQTWKDLGSEAHLGCLTVATTIKVLIGKCAWQLLGFQPRSSSSPSGTDIGQACQSRAAC